MIGAVAQAFLRRGIQEALAFPAAALLKVLTLIFSLSSFFYLARFVGAARASALASYGGDYVAFGLVGFVVLGLQWNLVSAYPRAIREAQLAGTLEPMLGTPAPAWLILLCAPLYPIATAVVWALLTLLLAGVVFGVRFGAANLVSLAVTVPLSLLAFAGLGFLSAAFTMRLRRSDPLTFFLSGLSALLGGVFYPRAVLPGWLRLLGKLLPITHSLELIRRATFAGAGLVELGPTLLGLLGFCAAVVPAGLLAFGWSIRRARREGSLTHF